MPMSCSLTAASGRRRAAMDHRAWSNGLGRIALVYYYSSTTMKFAMNLQVDARSPIPIRRQLTEQLKHAIEGGGIPRDQQLPSIRELAGFLGINPNTVARVIEDLQRDG